MDPTNGIPRRDYLIYLLSQPPSKLSHRMISQLRVVDFTPDNGATWIKTFHTGTKYVPISNEILTLMKGYVFRHFKRGAPFLEWRPDIPPYLFQSARKYREDQPLSRTAVRDIIVAVRALLEGDDNDDDDEEEEGVSETD